VCTLTVNLTGFKFCDSSGFPTRVSVGWEKRYQNCWNKCPADTGTKNRTHLNEPTVSYVNPNLIICLGFYSTKYELLQFSFSFAVFFLSGGYYFFNIISCRFYFIFRWPLFFFFFFLGIVIQTYLRNIQS
jgi:hypothetical protein